MKKRITIIFIVLILAIPALLLLNLFSGSSNVGIRDMANIIFNHDTQSVFGVIVWNIRIPRLLEAMVLGGALALSGYLLQTFFANPIAGPFVLGISSGAKMCVAMLMIISVRLCFSLSSMMMVAVSFIGSCLATAIVIFVAKKVKNMAVLIVCGVMIGYVCSSVTELLVAFADDSNIVNLHNWSMGSFASASWSDVRITVPIIVVGIMMAILLSKGMSVYMFGEGYAQSVGMNVRVFRVLLIVASCILSATVTAFAGPISFVGIAVPHVIRTVTKSNNVKVMVTASFLGGAVFCLLCDFIARSMFAPMELSISTITAVFGAPIVVLMLLKRKR